MTNRRGKADRACVDCGLRYTNARNRVECFNCGGDVTLLVEQLAVTDHQRQVIEAQAAVIAASKVWVGSTFTSDTSVQEAKLDALYEAVEELERLEGEGQ